MLHISLHSKVCRARLQTTDRMCIDCSNCLIKQSDPTIGQKNLTSIPSLKPFFGKMEVGISNFTRRNFKSSKKFFSLRYFDVEMKLIGNAESSFVQVNFRWIYPTVKKVCIILMYGLLLPSFGSQRDVIQSNCLNMNSSLIKN